MPTPPIQPNRAAFISLGTFRNNGKGETKYYYRINRSILLEVAKLCTSPLWKNPTENRAITRFGFLCAEFGLGDGRRPHIGRSFSIREVGDDYLTVEFNASLLRPLGIILKASTNPAVASWGLTCLSDYDGWIAAAS